LAASAAAARACGDQDSHARHYDVIGAVLASASIAGDRSEVHAKSHFLTGTAALDETGRSSGLR
jgi:hypothetical protein